MSKTQPNQELIDLHGDADGGPDRSTSGSDRAPPPVHLDPTPQMREAPSLGISYDPSRRFVRLESLVEMIALHVGLVEPEDSATTPEDLSAASEPDTPAADVYENVNDENEATPSMRPRKKTKLAESSGSEPDRGEDNNIFFLPPGSSPKTFPVDDPVKRSKLFTQQHTTFVYHLLHVVACCCLGQLSNASNILRNIVQLYNLLWIVRLKYNCSPRNH